MILPPTPIWILKLSDMRTAEGPQVVAYSNRKRKLSKLIRSELVDIYTDTQWAKHFRRGGPLEWFEYIMGDEVIFRTTYASTYWVDVDDLLE